MTIKHAFVSGIVDGADTSLVRPTDWNNDHQVDADGLDTPTAMALKVGAANATSVQLGKAGVGVSAPGGVTADLTGNAATATKLATARAINGVDFDGSAPITINAVDSTAREPAIAAGTTGQYLRGDKSWQTTPTSFPGLGTSAETACAGNDARLSNARAASDVAAWAKAETKPAYAYSEITSPPTLGTAAAKNVPATGDAGSTEVVLGADSRLTDARSASGGTAANVSGTVAIANGGTGATTRQAALDAIAGAVTSGQVLRGNGTNVALAALQAGDVPTLNQDTTGTAAAATVARSVDTAAATALAIGGTNAASVQVGRDGIALTHGVVWDDFQGPALQGGGNAALTQEQYRDTGAIMLFLRHDQDDLLTFAFQMSHRRKSGTEVRVHIHYIPMVTPATDQVVRIGYAYHWAHVGAELPAISSWTTGYFDITVPASGADTFKHKVASLFATTPTGDSEASGLMVRITRISSSASDTYTTAKSGTTTPANFAVLSIDAHYQTNKPGSVDEIPA